MNANLQPLNRLPLHVIGEDRENTIIAVAHHHRHHRLPLVLPLVNEAEALRERLIKIVGRQGERHTSGVVTVLPAAPTLGLVAGVQSHRRGSENNIRAVRLRVQSPHRLTLHQTVALVSGTLLSYLFSLLSITNAVSYSITLFL